MNRARIRWCWVGAHAALFLGVAVAIWRIREPGVSLLESIVWHGGFGLFIFELPPFGTAPQLVLELFVAILVVALGMRNVRANRSFGVAWNILVVFLYLFPFAVSTFGDYIGP